MVLALVISLLGAMFVTQAPPAEASHLRAAQLTWHRGAGDVVEFHVSQSARRSYYFGTDTDGMPKVGDLIDDWTLDFGDGTSNYPNFTVVQIDKVNDWLIAEAHVEHTYTAPGPFTARVGTCCRLSAPEHINNPNGDSYVETLVDLSATRSPESGMSPIVDCPQSGACSFSVPAILPAGTTGNWRFATATEAAGEFGSFTQPGPPNATNAATINPTTGVYSWDTTGATLNPDGVTYYSTQVVIESVANNAPVSKVAVDFFIRLGDSTSTNSAPTFTTPTPVDGTTINATVGSPVTFDVAASDADTTDTVTLAMLNRPGGATYATTDGNPASGTFTWTPTAAGSTILTLTAQDQFGLGAIQRSVTIVAAEPTQNQAPVFDGSTPADGALINGTVGTQVTFDTSASDPDTADTVVLGMTGTPGDATYTTTDGNPATGSFSWTPTTAGDTFVTLTATDDHGATAAQRVVQISVSEPSGDIVVNNDAATTLETKPVTVPVLDNDLPEGMLSVVDPTQGTKGSVTCDGYECTYTPSAGASGSDTFTYKATDGTTTSGPATVTVTIESCPDLSSAISGQAGLVTGQAWHACSAIDANGTSAKTTPMMPAPDGDLALMTSGDRANFNASSSTSSDRGRANHLSLNGANDVSILELGLNVPAGHDCLSFDAAFASEEFPEFVGSSFNDAFIAQLGTLDWNVEGSTITAPNNIAKDADGKVLSINSGIFDYAIDASGGNPGATHTEYDGATPLLRIQTPVTAGATKLFLSIFDASDESYDSAALIDRLQSRVSNNDCTTGAAPVVVTDDADAVTPEDTPATIQVVADGLEAQTVDVAIATQPAHGFAEILPAENGFAEVSYDPDENWHSTLDTPLDTFTYAATVDGVTSTSTVSVEVQAVDDNPTAADELVDSGLLVPFAIELDGGDVDDATTAFEVVTPPAHGELGEFVVDCVPDGDGSVCTGTIEYTETDGSTEPDMFTYRTADATVHPPQVDEFDDPVTTLYSDEQTVTIEFGTVPEAPVVDGAGGDNELTVTWDAPFDGGLEITGYTVECVPQDPVLPTPPQQLVDGATLEASFTGLTNNKAYDCSVVATNAVGDSAPGVVTLTPIDDTGPGALDPFNVTPRLRKADLSWVHPSDPDYRRLVVRMTTGTTPAGGPGTGTLIYDKTKPNNTATTASKTGLSNGATYTFSAFTLDDESPANWTRVSRTVFGTSLGIVAKPSTLTDKPGATTDMVAIKGTLKKAGTTVVLPNEGVTLWGRPKSPTNSAFSKIGSTKTTNSSGVVNFTHDLVVDATGNRQHWEYQLRFAGAGTYMGTESTRKTVLFKPALVFNAPSKVKGGWKLAGTLSPYYTGDVVYLQKKVSGAWKDVSGLAKTMAAPTGSPSLHRFSWTVNPSGGGTHYYRLRFPAESNVHLAATTGQRSFTK